MGSIHEVDRHGKALVDGHKYKSYEDTSFTAGDSPVEYDVNTDLGYPARDGYIVCDGAGNITVNISHDGTNYGDDITLKAYDVLDLKPLNVSKIMMTWVSNSSYRILVC